MCDCYNHKCDAPGCKVFVPMHLEDYSTQQDEIFVFCEAHMNHVKAYEYFDDEDNTWKKCYVIAITENALNHSEGNTPNAELKGE